MRKNPRIFSLMLTAFGLVIVLGIGGMLLFFWVAVLSFQRGHDDWGAPPEFVARGEAARLAQVYRREGSWEGVEPRFDVIERQLRDDRWQSITLLDADGQVVSRRVGTEPMMPMMPMMASAESMSSRPPRGATPLLLPVPPEDVLSSTVTAGGVAIVPANPVQMMSADGQVLLTIPIQLRDETVGALVIDYASGEGRTFGFANLARGVGAAGLALAGILLGLAIFFSRRISTPLAQLNQAARALTAGDMQVRVEPGRVREVADLALSFNQLADALAAADQQRRQLTADVAHELRTPLSIIKGRLEGVQDGVYEPDQSQIAGLLGEVALLERLIEDLRLLALADAGQLALYPEPCAPAHLLHDTARSFARQAEEQAVALHVEAADALPEVLVDPQRISQVLGNLVGNALRHSPPGGQITLSAQVVADEGVAFAVSDTGHGIAPADLPHIFDRFYRVDRARSRSAGGAGLGLAIARRIIETHGGTINATSTLGHGTTMRFVLPLEPASDGTMDRALPHQGSADDQTLPA
ncbi:sensor histidine kinase [Candidatus Chloroploca mongolica]|nr:HAMP domain-containing sensor histidine kinase [Candidatus Chloroploca mongolica]